MRRNDEGPALSPRSVANLGLETAAAQVPVKLGVRLCPDAQPAQATSGLEIRQWFGEQLSRHTGAALDTSVA